MSVRTSNNSSKEPKPPGYATIAEEIRAGKDAPRSSKSPKPTTPPERVDQFCAAARKYQGPRLRVGAASERGAFTGHTSPSPLPYPLKLQRGTVDDKDNLVAGLMLILQLKRSGAALDRDVILLAESGEEGAPDVGAQFTGKLGRLGFAEPIEPHALGRGEGGCVDRGFDPSNGPLRGRLDEIAVRDILFGLIERIRSGVDMPAAGNVTPLRRPRV